MEIEFQEFFGFSAAFLAALDLYQSVVEYHSPAQVFDLRISEKRGHMLESPCIPYAARYGVAHEPDASHRYMARDNQQETMNHLRFALRYMGSSETLRHAPRKAGNPKS